MAICGNIQIRRLNFIREGSIWCSSDFYVCLNDILFVMVFVMPVFMGLIGMIMQSGNNIQVIIRGISRRQIIKKMICAIGIIAVYMNVCCGLTIWVLTKWQGITEYNWNQKDTVYYVQTGENVLQQGQCNYGSVISHFLLSGIILLMLIGMINLICWLLTSKRWTGYILCMLFLICSNGEEQNWNVITLLSISWWRWRYSNLWIRGVDLGIIEILILVIACLLIIRRKDLYGDNSI